MADKIVVLRDGRIEQVGAPMDLYRDPDNRFVAGFIGSPAMNFLDCDVVDGVVRHPALTDTIPVTGSVPSDAKRVTLGIRPEHVQVDRAGDTCTVDLTEALGGVSYSYLLTPNGDKLIVEERDDQRSAQGDKIGLSVRPERAMLFDPETGQRLR